MSIPPRLAAVLGLATVAFLAAPASAAAERIHDNDELNYELRVPDTWNWIDVAPFKAMNVVEAAERRLAQLADGTAADGQGARVMLAVQGVPASLNPDYETFLRTWQDLEASAKTLDPVPADVIKKITDARELLEKTLTEWVETHPEGWDLLLSRFDRDPKRWPKPEIDGQAIDIAGIPAVRLKVTAPCANLTGVVGPCEGRMFVFVVRKRLYRLAMWKWATPKDREHLRDDLDMIELSFDVPKKEAIPKKPDGPKGGDGGGMDGVSGGPGPDKPDAKKEVLKDLTFGFEVVKPAKFTARELDRSTQADRVLGFEFKAQSGGSDVFVDLQVYYIGRAGTTAFDIKTYLIGLWSGFLKQHPEGVIGTFPFPPVSVRSPFLSLPDMTKKKEIKRPPEADKDKMFSVGDMKEAGVATESKGVKMGTETMHETWRWCMTGNEPRRGEDTQVQYCFSTGERTFVIRVTARKDGWTIWKDDIAEVVRSFTIKDPPK